MRANPFFRRAYSLNVPPRESWMGFTLPGSELRFDRSTGAAVHVRVIRSDPLVSAQSGNPCSHPAPSRPRRSDSLPSVGALPLVEHSPDPDCDPYAAPTFRTIGCLSSGVRARTTVS